MKKDITVTVKQELHVLQDIIPIQQVKAYVLNVIPDIIIILQAVQLVPIAEQDITVRVVHIGQNAVQV